MPTIMQVQSSLPFEATSPTLAGISPFRELGAYEALWASPTPTFKRIADRFRGHPGALPSDFIPPSQAAEMARTVLGIFKKAGLGKFGIRVHQTIDYPERLRHARHPVELLYFQGNWDLAFSKCVAVRSSPVWPEHQDRKLLILDSCFQNSGLSWPREFEKRGALRVGDYGDIEQALQPEEGSEPAQHSGVEVQTPICGALCGLSSRKHQS